MSVLLRISLSDGQFFRPRHCCAIGALLGSAGIAGLAGLGQAGINRRTVAATNQANKEMNDATNQTNKEIAEANNATAIQIHNDDMNFNAQQAQIQRDWDSASAQRQRLVDAGYNPLMLGQGVEGGGSSAASAPAAPSLDSAVLNPNKFAPATFDGLRAIGEAMGILEKHQDVLGKKIKNEFDPKMFASELEAKQALISNLSLQNKQIAESLKWLPKKNLQQWELGELQKQNIESQVKFLNETFEDRKAQLSWLPKISARQWESFDYHKDLIMRQIKQMDEQSILIEAQKAKLAAETTTIEELRPEQLAMYREQLMAMRLKSAMSVLDVPTMFRAPLFDTLSNFGFDTSGFRNGLSRINWYREPNEYVKAFLYAAGLITGRIDMDDALEQIGSTSSSTAADGADAGRLGNLIK